MCHWLCQCSDCLTPIRPLRRRSEWTNNGAGTNNGDEQRGRESLIFTDEESQPLAALSARWADSGNSIGAILAVGLPAMSTQMTKSFVGLRLALVNRPRWYHQSVRSG